MAIRQIKSGRNKGRYVVDWYDEHRVRHKEIQGFNKNKALEIFSKKITERAERRTLDVRPGDRYSFEQVTVFYRNEIEGKKGSWKTDVSKIRFFNAAFGKRKIGDITREMITAYAQQRKLTVSGATVNRDIDILRRIFEFAIDSGWLEANPCRKWKKYEEPPAPDRIVEWGEYRQLLAAQERLGNEKGYAWRRVHHMGQFRYFIPLAYECGARREEIVRLTWNDINWTTNQVRFRYKKGKKAEWKERWVPMSDFVISRLKELSPRSDSPYLFPDENGHFCKSKISFYRCWTHILDNAEIKDIGFHTLRHSYNSHLANEGMDPETRMALMGHTSYVTQQRYTHMADERKRRASEIMNRLASGDSPLMVPGAQRPKVSI